MIPTLFVLLAVVAEERLPEEALTPEQQLEEEAEPAKVSGLGLPVEALCGRGERYLEDGSKESLLSAKRIFEVAVKFYPDESCAHAGLSKTALALFLRHIEPEDAHIDAALQAAQEAVRLDGRSANAHAALAMVLLADSRPVEAWTEAEEALRHQPEGVAALGTAAVIRAAQRRLESALELIRKALEVRPDLPGLYLTLGNLRLLSKERPLAIQAYETALALSPDLVPAAVQRAVAYEEMGDRRAAAIIFEKLLNESPEEAPLIHLYMGQSLMKRSTWRAALSVLARAEFKNRRGLSGGSVLFLKAQCHEELGQKEEARLAYRAVIEEWPRATGGLLNSERLIFRAAEELSALYKESGDLDAVVEVLETASGQPDVSFDVVVRLGLLYDQYRLHPQALVMLERTTARPLNPRHAVEHLQAYILWARIARSSGDAQSLARLEASLASHSSSLEEIDDYVVDVQAIRAFSVAGMGKAALETLRRAVEGGYSHLGWIAEDPELESLRQAPGFAELVEKARTSGHLN